MRGGKYRVGRCDQQLSYVDGSRRRKTARVLQQHYQFGKEKIDRAPNEDHERRGKNRFKVCGRGIPSCVVDSCGSLAGERGRLVQRRACTRDLWARPLRISSFGTAENTARARGWAKKRQFCENTGDVPRMYVRLRRGHVRGAEDVGGHQSANVEEPGEGGRREAGSEAFTTSPLPRTRHALSGH